MQLENSGHVISTAKALKGSRNLSKGDRLEQKHSGYIHKKGSAVLVSSLLLRQLNCGQIDLCVFDNIKRRKRIRIFEVKSKPGALSPYQRRRLNNSLELLIHIFDAEGQVLILNNLPKD